MALLLILKVLAFSFLSLFAAAAPVQTGDIPLHATASSLHTYFPAASSLAQEHDELNALSRLYAVSSFGGLEGTHHITKGNSKGNNNLNAVRPPIRAEIGSIEGAAQMAAQLASIQLEDEITAIQNAAQNAAAPQNAAAQAQLEAIADEARRRAAAANQFTFIEMP